MLERLERALHEDSPQRRLLHGVTGSGKTEIYLRLADAALARGRGAIVLVPEIALTPQISRRFAERFGQTVAVLHSRLSVGERHDAWLRLRGGQARLCVGPRSAIFAPIDDLGLIVVDEEHDASYKHEGDPRYDARTVAEWRARHSRALLLLGSATPRPESALRVGALRLSRRADDRPLPPVEVLDMRGQPHGLHPRTAEALVDTARAWRQGDRAAQPARVVELPLLPRLWARVELSRVRRVSRAASGGRAGWPATTAGIASRHRRAARRAALRPWPDTGPAQSDSSTTSLGSSTIRVFPSSASTPTRSARTGPGSVLGRFERASGGVLVGTQMVAKGHDFPGVSLGVVLDADATLRFPDFRAEERTFALIAQLAGRVGRGGPGQVLVQTLAPQARPIVARRGPRQRGLPDGRARAPPGTALPALLRAHPGGRGGRAPAPPPGPRRSSCATACGSSWTVLPSAARASCSVRPRSFACADASGRCCSSRRPSARPRCEPSNARCNLTLDAAAATGGQLQRRRRSPVAPLPSEAGPAN